VREKFVSKVVDENGDGLDVFFIVFFSTQNTTTAFRKWPFDLLAQPTHQSRRINNLYSFTCAYVWY